MNLAITTGITKAGLLLAFVSFVFVPIHMPWKLGFYSGLLMFIVGLSCSIRLFWKRNRFIGQRAQQWASEAPSAQEKARRVKAIDELGATDALKSAGILAAGAGVFAGLATGAAFSSMISDTDDTPVKSTSSMSSMPSFNIDGTPMMEGSMYDVNGHAYGVTSDSFSMGSDNYMSSDSFGNT